MTKKLSKIVSAGMGPLILLGSFASGFYLGQANKTGNSLDPFMVNLLKFSPAILAGLYTGKKIDSLLKIPDRQNAKEDTGYQKFENELDPDGAYGADGYTLVNPKKYDSGGCGNGCLLTFLSFAGAGLAGITTCIGYAVGNTTG